ncbi:PA domain-containing protein [Colwellia chukchiensis]|uniref:PA domain-containing protein n=1 Tax=Colwellia chukchiensis TaxID=641665 RepID=A0A1H7Q760_9GAMM|nr:S8 family serine peptidase [Colwellia chukchiensis]SEL43930.1 PA domain-containing protein [Colwellia chukchiensis]
MQSTFKAWPTLTALAAFVTSTCSYGAVANELTAVPFKVGPSLMTHYSGVDKSAPSVTKQFPTYYIIQLEDASLATYSGGVRGLAPTIKSASNKEKLDTQSVAAVAYRQYLQARQNEMAATLQSKFPSLQVQRNLSVTLNGLIVSVPGKVDLKAKLQNIPGVKKVFEHEMYKAHLDASLDLINAPAVWQALGQRDRAGEGIKIAVIDSGIRAEHPMFASNEHQRPAGLPTDDYCTTIDPTFCNDKLVLARYYTPTFPTHEDESISPLDVLGHGTHVAGTAAGNAVSTRFAGVDVNFSGVAPGASIMAYKALFLDPFGGGGGSNVMLVSALEDAVADGADVINNSWGGGAGGHPNDSVYQPIFTAAEAAGVVMVTAAGNDGPSAETVGCPACIEAGITVASTQTGRSFAHLVNAAGVEDINATPGDGDFEITSDISALLTPAINVDPANALGCEAFPVDSLKNNIVLISRGICGFTDKATNAQAAGAVGMIVYNNAPGVIRMSMEGIRLPSVSISQESGEAILAAWQEGSGATITKSQMLNDAAAVDAMSDFSSRGPNGDSSFLKPDLAAPGSDILSAFAPGDDETQYDVSSGTSMASPHVAGAAALLRQLRPELNAFQIKSILMTSSNPAVKMQDLTTAATPFDRGAGRLDVAAASKTALSFDKASFVATGCVATCSFERTVTNLMPTAGDWQAHVEFVNDQITGSLSTTELSIAEAGTATFTLTVNSAFADNSWQFGQVVWTDASGQYPAAHLPIAVHPQLSDDSSLVSTMLVAGEVTAGEKVSMSARAGYSGNDDFSTLSVKIPEGTELDVDSIAIEMSPVGLVAQNGFSVSPNKRVMTWTGPLTNEPDVKSIEPATSFLYPGFQLSDLGMDSFQIPCEAGCDEVSVDFPIGEMGGFIWNGKQVDVITISPNGFITAGQQFVLGGWQTQNLPSVDTPNAVIAPLWSDFVVGGAAGGQMNYNVVNDFFNDWFVIEWQDIAEYQTSTGDRFTFAIWIKLGTDEVYFNYIDVPELPSNAAVGIEDPTGTIGASRYFSGTGTAPVAGEALRARLSVGEKGAVVINYKLAAAFGVANDVVAATVEQTPVVIDLSNKFNTGAENLLSSVSLSSGDKTYNAIQPFDIKPNENVAITVVTAPEHGVLTPAMTTASDETDAEAIPFSYVYTADEGYVGADSFTYHIGDADGNKTNTATVTLNVARDNTAPVAQAAATPTAAKAGTKVTLSAAGSSDVDGDSLTYSWSQTAGPSVALTGATSASASFVAPKLGDDTRLTFSVSVSDGYETSTANTTVTVSKKSSSGSFGGLLILLALPLAFRRRSAVK